MKHLLVDRRTAGLEDVVSPVFAHKSGFARATRHLRLSTRVFPHKSGFPRTRRRQHLIDENSAIESAKKPIKK